MNFMFLIPILSFLIDFVLVVLNVSHQQKQPMDKTMFNNEEYQSTLDYAKDKSYAKLSYIFFRQLYFFVLVIVLADKIQIFSNLVFMNKTLSILLSILILYSLFQLIVTIYEGFDTFVTENKYGFNKTRIKTFIKDQLIDYLGTTFILMLVSFVLYLIYTNFSVIILVYGFIFIVLLLVLYHTLFVVLFIPLLFKMTPLENDALREKLTAFSEKEGFLITNIVVIDASKKTTKINAYFSGFGKQKKVMLFDTLLDKFSDTQLLAIVAHEIGHSKYKHMLKDMLFDIVLAFIYFAGFYFILQMDIIQNSANPFITSIVYTIISIELFQKLMKSVKNSISRKHEKQADLYCKEMGYGDELIHNLSVVAKINKGNLDPHPLFVFFKYDHPPYKQRIQYLQN